MSAFAVVYERSNTPVDPGVLERIRNRLGHRGPDGYDSLVADHVALGHWHFWTTPEEVDEKQPLQLEQLPYTIVMDGRLDNRDEIIGKLGINLSEDGRISDAALVLKSYAYWGEDCLDHFIGEYALVVWDESKGQMLCARDALGERTLFYTWLGTCLVIASEPWAMAGVSFQLPELNEEFLLDYFALDIPEDGRTFFKGIYELLPAHGLLVTPSSTRFWSYWEPDITKKTRGRTDREYADEFRELLDESVRCRLRSTTPVGVQMSGGLDSCSVACLAARFLSPQPLTTISYVFDELTECDERIYIDAIKKQWGIQSIQILGDTFWSFKDFQDWLLNPNHPHEAHLFLLGEQVYQRAQQEGLRVLLTGGTGDHLYSAGVNWLDDFLIELRFGDAWKELYGQFREKGWQGLQAGGFLRRMTRNFINALPGGRHLHRPWSAPVWTTPDAREVLQKKRKQQQTFPFVEQYSGPLQRRIPRNYSHGAFCASHYSVELRHPYRDRRLVEFVLTLPAHQLYRHGVFKHILRNAMQDILPDVIRNRRRPTSGSSLVLRGFEKEGTILRVGLQNTDAAWRKYVNSKYLIKLLDEILVTKHFDRKYMVLWSCVAYEDWYQALFRKE